NYLTGVASRVNTTNSSAVVLQSYIETTDTFGQPLTLRIGRQCLSFGKKFLISDKTTPTQRISFDAVRATYTPTDKLTIDAWVSKLFEGSPAEEDGDVDFYGVYATYAESDAVNASLYYMLVRDGRSAASIYKKTPTPLWLAGAADDTYEPNLLNTVGGRFWGAYEGFDYAAELAYQFGPADGEALSFASINGVVALPNKHWDNIGADVEVGYTFDCKWKPRLFLGGVYYQGGEAVLEGTDIRGNNLYMMKPSFNRLFSDTNYCPAVQDNGDMTNFAQVRGGVIVNPLDKVSVMLRGQQLWVTETVPGSSDNIGTQLDTLVKYQYSKDLLVMFYYGHLFNGSSTKNGNFIHSYGNASDLGTMPVTVPQAPGANDDADYMFWMLSLKI
ncbi:MAG: alginate export family protein, partial [Candidatus Hydrogenedentes bacterium]|nr:alginate export family protein [Candidatus Hydrogenedentota bacterium]